MDSKQYNESLLALLTHCESLEKTDYYPLENGKAFGMTRSELIVLADSLNRNHYVKVLVDSKRIILEPLTPEGHEKLEQLRDKLKGKSILVRFWRWILRNWHYFLLLFKQ